MYTYSQRPRGSHAGEQQARQRSCVLVLHVAVLQQLSGFLPGGLGLAQLELHVLSGTHAIRHSHGSIAGIHADQIAHQESPFGAIAACTDLIQARQHCIGNQLLPFHTQEQ